MIRIFKLTAEQKQSLKEWNDRQINIEFIEWHNRQKNNSEKINEILKKTKFKEGKDLKLDELYQISKLLTADLGNTALSIVGESSIFERNGLPLFNTNLRNLLFGKNSLTERVDQFVELIGVGPMTVSQFLCLYDYKKYAFIAGFMEKVFNNSLLFDQNQLETASKQAEREFLSSGPVNSFTTVYFYNFIILREIKDFLKFESYLHVQNLLWRIYKSKDSLEINDKSEVPGTKNWWIEKTYLTGVEDRETGQYALGKALWSPQRDKGNRDIYSNMRKIKKGDIVLHLVDNNEFKGLSIVENECDPEFNCLPNTPHDDGTGKRPGYYIALKDYEEFEKPVGRSDILNERYKRGLLRLLENGHWLFFNKKLELNQGSYITEAPQQLVEILNDIYAQKNGRDLPFWHGSKSKILSLDQLSVDVFLPANMVSEWKKLLEEKKQIIFYGPPGTGKTFVAKKFADYFVQNGGKVELVQFHPSYSYEDFVEGIKPTINNENSQIGYQIADGILKRLVEEAKKNPDKKFVILIDEINRGNIAKIFGELIYCLEYRGKNHRVLLPYSQEYFFIPENLYVLGTMNSADRSIALVDYALRRRFNFIDFMPKVQILSQWFEKNPPIIEKAKLIELMQKINLRIKEDEKLGKHFQIGHSYFMYEQLDKERLMQIWTYNIIPLLEEYYFEDEEALQTFHRIFTHIFESNGTDST